MSSSKWKELKSGPAATSQVTGGRIVFNVAANVTDFDTWAAVSLYDAHDSSMALEVVARPPVGVVGPEGYFGYRIDAANAIDFIFAQGNWVASIQVDGGWDYPAASAVTGNQRFWRIRETAGMLHYEVSPDGTVWGSLHSMPRPWNAQSVEPFFGTGTYRAIDAGFQVIIDNLNLP